MTTTTAPGSPTTAPPSVAASGARPVMDAVTMAWRNLLNLKRTPELVVFATIQPIIFVLMFVYVFGGAISSSVPGGVPYVDFLMPGVFVQTIVFGSLSTGVGLAEDLQKGLISRFRSLPMARSAVLVGRTLADFVRNSFVLVLMSIVGFLVGWRIQTGLWGFLGTIALTLAFSYSLSWLFAIIGLVTKNGETAQAASFPFLAVMVFASSAFVPVSSMPSWLQPWAEHQPVSVVIEAGRALTLGGSYADDTLSLCLQSIAWIVAIVAVCAPIAVHRYRRVS
jgi:ABC-2 type transport system permease protein/oleandomycin transport system permease protein